MTAQKSFILQALFFFLLFSNSSFAQVDPKVDWQKIELPGFDLIYDAKQQDLAVHYARRLAQLREALSPYFSHFPEKTVVVLNDNTDLTNGYATSIPYPLIMIFPVHPTAHESISEYGDWEWELLVHEYTHILSFETRRGIPKVLHTVFGSIITPNQILPRWFLEGVAVDFETRLSNHGRLRSQIQEAWLRVLFKNNFAANLNFAEINEGSIPSFPYGSRPYLYGSLIWNEIISQYGISSVQNLHWSHGGRVPFFLEGAAENTLGRSYTSLAAASLRELDRRLEIQRQVISETPSPALKPFPAKGIENFSPSLSPDGLKLAYLSRSANLRREVRFMQRKSATEDFSEKDEIRAFASNIAEEEASRSPNPRHEMKHQDGPPGGTVTRISWFPNSNAFAFDKVSERRWFRETSEIMKYDLTTKKTKSLTPGLRARDPDVSPDGKRLAFIGLEGGRTDLRILDLETQKVETIRFSKLGQRLSNPVFISKDELFYLERTNGTEKSFVLNLTNKQIRQILPDFQDLRFVFFHSGEIYFVSGKNGIPNLYSTKDFKTAERLTHVDGAVGPSSVDSKNKKILLTALTEQGQKIFTQDITGAKFDSKSKPVPGLYEDRFSSYDVPRFDSTATGIGLKEEIKDYSAWSYIWPRYWLPTLNISAERSLYGAFISSRDPLGQHSYSLQVNYDTGTEKASYLGTYTNLQSPLIIGLQAYDIETSTPINSINYKEQMQELSALNQFHQISTELYAGLGWNWKQRQTANSETQQSGPSIQVRYLNSSMSGNEISPRNGQNIVFRGISYLKKEDMTSYWDLNFRGQQFVSKFLPLRHALMLQLQGRYVDKDVSIAESDPTVSFNSFSQLNLGPPVMRGFPSGSFLSSKYGIATLEYRFPLDDSYRGFGLSPVFFRRLHAAAILEGIQAKGFVYSDARTADFEYLTLNSNRTYGTAGLEVKLDTTIGYHFGLTFYVGFYQTLQKEPTSAENIVLGLQM
jgi:Tol biopolymer transport system component